MPDVVAIECRGVRVVYRRRRLFGPPHETVAVGGVDLVLPRGSCFGLLGPNGAGKTSLIEVLEGLRPATAGEVRVLGRSWREGRSYLRSRIGVTSQETHFWDCLSVREVLTLISSFYLRPVPIDTLIEMVGLGPKAGSWVGRLSGGQRQRLALAGALAGRPELLFLDEPTTGLDPSARRDIWEVIRQCRHRGTTVVLTTHYLEEAEVLCDRVAILEQGKILREDTPSALVSGLGFESRIDLELSGAPSDAGEPPRDGPSWIHALLATAPGVSRVAWAAPQWTLASAQPAETVTVLMRRLPEHGLSCRQISVRRPNLEEVFLNLTAGGSHSGLKTCD